MPELPEVETVRKSLETAVVGARVGHVEVGRERSVRRTSPAMLSAGLIGNTFTTARRRGKYLLFDLSSRDTMVVHLRMSGRLLLADPTDAREPHTHVVIRLVRSGHSDIDLRFVDPRTFGEVVVYDPNDIDPNTNEAFLVPEVGRLGIDPLVDNFTFEEFRAAIGVRHRGAKAVLLDQSVIAGIGNIYVDEILHRSRIRWNRPVSSLSIKQLRLIHDSTILILNEAVAAGGSTLKDMQYVDALGREGIFQTEHKVYARQGERCLSCARGVIRRVTGAGRSTHFCPVCQR